MKALARGDADFAFLTLKGWTGSGKTHLALGILWDWLERGSAAFYRQVEDMLEEFKALFNRPPGDSGLSFEGMFRGWENVPLAVLDDLGVENPTDWAVAKLDTLVDFRYLRHLPTVFTTNLDLDALPPRVASRLQDVEVGRVIDLGRVDYRRRRRASVRGSPQRGKDEDNDHDEKGVR